MSFEELRRYIHDLQQSGFDVVRLKVQLQRKLAVPVVTLVMAVLAIPFSLSAGKRGAVTGIAVAVGIAGVYEVVSRLFESMGNLSQLPPALAAWSPDLIFAMLGAYLILKVPTCRGVPYQAAIRQGATGPVSCGRAVHARRTVRRRSSKPYSPKSST